MISKIPSFGPSMIFLAQNVHQYNFVKKGFNISDIKKFGKQWSILTSQKKRGEMAGIYTLIYCKD